MWVDKPPEDSSCGHLNPPSWGSRPKMAETQLLLYQVWIPNPRVPKAWWRRGLVMPLFGVVFMQQGIKPNCGSCAYQTEEYRFHPAGQWFSSSGHSLQEGRLRKERQSIYSLFIIRTYMLKLQWSTRCVIICSRMIENIDLAVRCLYSFGEVT